MEKEKRKKGVKKVSKEKLKIQNRGRMNFLLGFSLVLLGVFLSLSIGTVIFLTNSSEFKEYISSLTSQEISVDERKIVITNEESNVVNIVQDASPSVVSIAVSQLTLSRNEGLVDRSNNIGTGFIVDSEGVIVTNQHVVSDMDADYKVVTKDGQEFEVVEVVRDDLNDLAIINIDPGEAVLSELSLGNSDDLLVGQSVIAIGTPLGQYAGSVTTGIISGLDRSVTASSGWFGSTAKTYENVIQTDAAVNPGNSGGPLLDSQGKVIGINFATTSSADNISFAIPINKVKSRIDEYRTYGKFIKPYLGVTYQMISEYEAYYYEDIVPGALVLRVDPTAPAFEAGLERGDIIKEFGEYDVDKSLGEIIQEHDVGQEVDVLVYREGEEVELSVVLGEMD